MKKLSMLLIAAACVVSTSAHAFITVIDITNVYGHVTTVQSPSDVDYNQIGGTELSYRGLAGEAAALFESLAMTGAPGYTEVKSEINPDTQTIAVTVRVQGLVGWTYSYWVLRKAGE